jgi:glycosyltransferase involved in cell wall biosynthesis
MRVLVVLTQPPLPEGGAPGRTSIGLLRGLASHGISVQALAARQHFALPGEPPRDLGVEVVDLPPEPPGWRARRLRLTRPRGELGRGAFAARVREAARDADVVHLEETETAWADEGLDLPALVHLHYLVRRDRSLATPWRRETRDAVELHLAERAALRRHRYLVASSPLVAEELRRWARHAEVVHAPLALDPELYAAAPLDGPPLAGLIGTGAWPPTRAAVDRLVTRVWPRIRSLAPEARLAVAGRGVAVPGGAPAGVEVVGELPSGREFLRGLSVLVFPLERGSGMKVKVLEAIASGVPVVTTRAGAEGIDGGGGVIVEETDERLAQAAAALLLDAGERRERGAAARAAFERSYAPEVATRPLVDLYRRMAGVT